MAHLSPLPANLQSLGITKAELNDLIRRERSKLVRKRLVALRQIVSGATISQAARHARVRSKSVSRWLQTLRLSGLAALLIPTRNKVRMLTIPTEQLQLVRQEIAAALKRQPNWRLRLRLVAIDTALSGRPAEEAAACAHVQLHTLNRWMGMVRQRGIVEVLQQWETPARPLKLNADAMTLRDLAAREKNPRIRKRFLALADVADGKNFYDAAASSGLDRTAIAKWIKRFEEGGPDAIRKKEGRAPKLTRTQLDDLRAQLCEHPELSLAELHDLIWSRFGVRYSNHGIALLLANQLGVVRPLGPR